MDESEEIREVIEVIEMLSGHADGVDDKHMALMSTPRVLVKALGVTLKKSDEVWNYLQEEKGRGECVRNKMLK